MTDVHEAAMLWARRGACVLPTRPDGTKAPSMAWKQYCWPGVPHPTPSAPSAQIVDRWFNAASTGLGLILGAVSGNLEMLELEGRAVDEGLLGEFRVLLTDNGLDGLWGRLRAGYVELTPSGGLHFIYRVSDGRALGNTKLAARLSTPQELIEAPGQRIRVLIETRGEGGHVVIAPSHGPTHSSGLPWVVTSNSEPAVITSVERDALFAVARMLDRVPAVERPVKAAWQQHGDTTENPWATHRGGISPLDDFESKTDWADILEPHGWQHVDTDDGTTYWLRPGKSLIDTDGWAHSASTGHWDDRDTMYVWSTSTDLPAEQQMTKGFVYAVLNHDGDLSAAARALIDDGFGTKPRRRIDESDPEYDAAKEKRLKELEAHGYFLPDAFWTNSDLEALPHLRRAAWAQGVSPDAVLIAAMVKVVARVGPQVKIPAWVASKASLNFGAVIIGDSGDSKSGSVDVAEDVLSFGNAEGRPVAPAVAPVHVFCPSTPQGIAAQYQTWEKQKGAAPLFVRKEITAICDVDEGDQLRGAWERHGIGLIAELRKALMGKSIGFGNVGETKTNLSSHSYRFGFLLCTLPTHADWILSDDVGGFPQRLVWACATDSRVIKDVEWPGRYMVRMDGGCFVPAAGETYVPPPDLVLTADPTVEAEVKKDHDRRRELGHQPGDLDGHAILTREKVAWILALMHGRTHIRYGVEWYFAAVFMESSNAARAYAQKLISERNSVLADRIAVGRGKSRATEEKVYSESREGELRGVVTKRVLAYLSAQPGITKADLRRKFKATDGTRDAIGDKANPQVLEALLVSGQIRFEDIVRNGTVVGSRWYLAGHASPKDPFSE